MRTPWRASTLYCSSPRTLSPLPSLSCTAKNVRSGPSELTSNCEGVVARREKERSAHARCRACAQRADPLAPLMPQTRTEGPTAKAQAAAVQRPVGSRCT
jgi:hypothetical protein